MSQVDVVPPVGQGPVLKPVRELALRTFGTAPSVPTIWRWIKQGQSVAGRCVKLTALKGIGGAWLTTESAWEQFVRARSGEACGEVVARA